jgi:Mrp family chromosome partitioning ATPase
MHQLHQDLKTRADVVLYDSPPFLATADAQILSSEVDGVLYVVQFGEAKKSAVRHASEMIQQTRARVLGVVFNKIDLSNKRDDYYYGYYNYYSYYSAAGSPELENGQPRKRHREFDAISSHAASNGTGNGKGSHELIVAVEPEDEEELA